MLKGQTQHIDKEQSKTKHEAPRSVNYRATQNKNIGTTALERIGIGICMSEHRNEMVKTFPAEATSLKFTYIQYGFETFLQVVEIITSKAHDIKVLSIP